MTGAEHQSAVAVSKWARHHVGEHLAAARMTPGGLSLWEALAIIKQGFLSAFLPAADRERLLKEVDARIFRVVLEGAPRLAP